MAGAQRFASLAMTARARLDHELFALHAGVAAERLAKAVLAGKNPALLLDIRGGRRSTDMLYHLTGLQALSAERLWTIGATEAISRLRDLEVLPRDPTLDRLIELRNGVAHSVGEDVAEEDLLPTFARTVDALLRCVDLDASEFWGEWRLAATAAASWPQNKAELDVQLRIKQARDLYSERTTTLPPGTMYESTTGDKATFGVGYLEDHVRVIKRVDCPACSQLAMVEMAAYVDRMTGEKAVFAVNQLFCSHCRLTVAGPAELEAVGLETSVEVNFSEEPRDVVESTLSCEAQRYWKRRDYWANYYREERERQEYAARTAADRDHERASHDS
jgi:hypothetical protein